MGEMIFEGKLDESEVGKVQVNMDIVLTIGAIDRQSFKAKLEYIAPKGITENGAIQFLIRASISKDNSAFLRAGYSANADIILAKKDKVLAIPESVLHFEKEKPYYVIIAAARVGGIHANNTFRADFIYDNLMIEANLIHAAYAHKVEKLLFLGSSCIYPKMANQPLKEEYILGGYLEETNKPYAVAKLAGIELCASYAAQYGCNFISAMPTNLYGTNDNYHPENSHVFPALVRKIVLAKRNNEPNISIWGTGTPLREFLHVDDLADACYFLMQN
jgi:GDP-L-fucose synthase